MSPSESSLSRIVVFLSVLVVLFILAIMAFVPADSATDAGDSSISMVGRSLSLSSMIHSPSTCRSATALKAMLSCSSSSSLSVAVTSTVADVSPAGIVTLGLKLKRFGCSAIRLTVMFPPEARCVVMVRLKLSPSVISLFDADMVSCGYSSSTTVRRELTASYPLPDA